MSKSDRLYCVYMHTNKFNNKKYIGITCRDPEVRWNHGKGYLANLHFWRAIEKDGWDNFTHEIIKEGLTKQAAHKLERELIAYHNTRDENFGYNQSCGGEGGAKYLMESERIAARKQTHKKHYEKLKQDELKYDAYLQTNKEIHKTSYYDPSKQQAIRNRLNACKQRYRKDPEFLEKDRAATRKIKAEIKEIRAKLIELLLLYPDCFTSDEITLISGRKSSNGDFICQSKVKLQKILDNFSKNN